MRQDLPERNRDDQDKHRYCTNKFIELANQLKDEQTDPALVSGALMTASCVYATFVAAGNQGAVEPSGLGTGFLVG